MLPNLVVIGAAKCATTSLHEYLDTHPEIVMSRPKELDFFVPEKSRGRSLEWYERQFRDAPVRGETSPSYTVHPFRPGVPERMHAVIPGARLIYLVRDPIDRIVLAPAWARSRFRLPYERPVPSAELRHRLEEELRPDVEQLRQHTGLPLAGWSL